jgi:hypothetical protein
MARPIKQVKRKEKLTLYYTKIEYKLIEKLASHHGLSKAEFARMKSLNHRLRPKMTLEEAAFYRKLTGMANNLNQLARAANRGEVFTLKILKTLDAINFVIDRLR